MNVNSPNSMDRRKWLWPALAVVLLLAWTAYCHLTWVNRAGHLHGLQGLFLGVLVLLVVSAAVRLCIGTWKRGLRWLVSGAAWRLCGWTVLFALSTVVLFYNVELWRGKRAWASVVREAGLRGEKLTVESITPPLVPDEQNFARAPFFAPLMVVSNGVSGNERKLLAEETGQFEFVAHWEQWPFLLGRDEPNLPAGYIKAAPWLELEKTDLRAWMGFTRGWTNEPARSEDGMRPYVSRLVPDVKPPEAAALLLAGLRQPFDGMLEQLRPYSDRPYCRFPADYRRQVLDGGVRHYAVLHGFMRILRLRACAELVLGQDELALRDVQLALRLADYVRQQPWAESVEVRLNVLLDTLQPVWEGLAERRWNERQLAALQAQLAALDVLADYPLTVRNDAFAMANLAERIIPTSPETTRALPGLLPDEARAVSVVRFFYPTGWSLQDQASIHRFHLELASQYLDLSARRIVGERKIGKSRREWHGAFGESDPFFPVFMTPKLLNVFVAATEHFPFAQTAVDLATVACSLERYRLVNGEFPATLDSLVPQFLPQLPHDIINGEPLKYRRTVGGGFVLYSVGFNQTDDGGQPCGRKRHWEGLLYPKPDLDKNDWVWSCPAVVSGIKP